jgi:hypothetical protein
VPFSRRQYFRYQARLASQGLDGLHDGLSPGNRRKLTPEAEGFLRGVHQRSPELSLEEMRHALQAALRIDGGAAEAFIVPLYAGRLHAGSNPREACSAGGGDIAGLFFRQGWNGTGCWIRDCGRPGKGTKRARNVPFLRP